MNQIDLFTKRLNKNTGKMRVLIACESSGRVREAFRKLGHDAWSCDILPADDGSEFHITGDVTPLLLEYWDLIIGHPPCTFLTIAAEWAYKEKQTKKIKPGTLIGKARQQARIEALEFIDKIWNANSPRICIENPVGVIPKSRPGMPKPFYIQPYQFGHAESKKTGLWLKGLEPLEPEQMEDPRYVCCGEVLEDMYGCPNCLGENDPLPRGENQTNSGQNNLPPSDDRWKLRSATYQGIADAMANQWGGQTDAA